MYLFHLLHLDPILVIYVKTSHGYESKDLPYALQRYTSHREEGMALNMGHLGKGLQRVLSPAEGAVDHSMLHSGSDTESVQSHPGAAVRAKGKRPCPPLNPLRLGYQSSGLLRGSLVF